MGGKKHLKPAEMKAIALLGEGKGQRDIAKETGLSQPTVSRINSAHRDLIQQQQARFIDETLVNIADRSINEITIAKNMSEAELKDPKNQTFLSRVDKKEDGILRSVGINPSNAQSIHIQNIFNNNSKTILNPVVAGLIREHNSALELTEDDEIWEAEVV